MDEQNVMSVSYSLEKKEWVRIVDYANSIQASRKTLRKKDVKIRSASGNVRFFGFVFTLLCAILALASFLLYYKGDPLYGSILTILRVPAILAVISFLLYALILFGYRKHDLSGVSTLVFTDVGIRDKCSDKEEHFFTWDKLDMCVMTDKVTVFIFKETQIYFFAPSTEEVRGVVHGALKKYGKLDCLYYRRLK